MFGSFSAGFALFGVLEDRGMEGKRRPGDRGGTQGARLRECLMTNFNVPLLVKHIALLPISPFSFVLSWFRDRLKLPVPAQTPRRYTRTAKEKRSHCPDEESQEDRSRKRDNTKERNTVRPRAGGRRLAGEVGCSLQWVVTLDPPRVLLRHKVLEKRSPPG